MLAEIMIPEAFEEAQNFIGLITVAGVPCLLCSYKTRLKISMNNLPFLQHGFTPNPQA
jgi:hypothetical protein